MNNSFVNSISDICGLETAAILRGYKYSVYDGRAVVIEGHKGIFAYGEKEVVFLLKKGKITIGGNQLSIKCLDGNFAVVEGVICDVAVDNA